MDKLLKSDRRSFLKQMGFITIGFNLSGFSRSMGILSSTNEAGILDDSIVSAWLTIKPDGQIEVLTGKSELGQGVSTAIKQVAAEELNTSMDMVSLVLAQTEVTPNEGYTAGSRSIETSAMSVRYAAATARELLINFAAYDWSVNRDYIKIENGFIYGEFGKINIGDILKGRQIVEEIDRKAPLRGKSIRKYVGQAVKRDSIAKMVRGEEYFIHDLRFPDMVHARVVRPNAYGAKLKSLNTRSFEGQDGLLKVIKLGSFVGVLAEEEYQAVQIREELKKAAVWEGGEKLPVGKDLKEYIKGLKVDSNTDESRGNPNAFKEGEFQHSASYFKPYIMHASNGPSCALALFQNEVLHVWSHTQGVYPLREAIADLVGLSRDKVNVKSVPGSGCYGHNAADDVAAEAALLAVNFPDKHVRLQWMRDDEHGWEPFGTAMMMELKASLNKDGEITDWSHELWSDSHSTRPRGNGTNLLPSQYIYKGYSKPGGGFRGGATRNAVPYYDIPNLVQKSHLFEGPLRVSALRGLGATANLFAMESFMEELAYELKQHPLDFRLTHLNDSRAREVVERLKAKTDQVKTSKNQGIGYAFSRYKNSASYLAMATLVEVNDSGAIQLKKMWGVIDAGECINPDGLKNQTEGGMIQATSWALMEQVGFDEEHITSKDWYSYPILRFPNIPEVDVEVIDRPNEEPLGAGETAQGPATAALANAIFTATGERRRDWPLQNKA